MTAPAEYSIVELEQMLDYVMKAKERFVAQQEFYCASAARTLEEDVKNLLKTLKAKGKPNEVSPEVDRD